MAKGKIKSQKIKVRVWGKGPTLESEEAELYEQNGFIRWKTFHFYKKKGQYVKFFDEDLKLDLL